MNKTVLIAGASRGIGLELAVQYAAEGWQVIAGCRNPDAARRWLAPQVELQALDVTAPASIEHLRGQLEGRAIDLLVVNAGVAGPAPEHFAAPGALEFDVVMHTNVLGPIRLIEAFAPLVENAQGVIAVLSSRMGSLAETRSADTLTYRCSKAAVNMVVKTAAAEYGPRGVITVALHPGWVRTDMGGEHALVGVSESVEGLRRVIGDLVVDRNGCFFDYTGRPVSW